MRQFRRMDAATSRVVGWWVRAWNASVSCSDRRSTKMQGMIMQPTKKGMRQPQASNPCFDITAAEIDLAVELLEQLIRRCAPDRV